MEQAHQPLSNSPYMQPASTSQVLAFPLPQLNQPLSVPQPNNQLESNEQLSMICGFTLTELANVAIQVSGVIIAAVFGAWAVKAYESANIANQLSEDSLSQSNIANILAVINLCLTDQFRAAGDCPAVLQAARFASIVHHVIPTLPTPAATTLSHPPPSATPTITPTTAITPTTTITPDPTTVTAAPPPPTAPPPAPPPASPSTSSAPTTTYFKTTVTSSATISPPGTDGATLPSAGSNQLAFGTIVGIIIAVVIVVTAFCLLLIRYQRAKRSRF